MYTLKIKWTRHDRVGDGLAVVVDEADIFIAADRVRAGGLIRGDDRHGVNDGMKAWAPDQFEDYLCVVYLHDAKDDSKDSSVIYNDGRLIEVRNGSTTTWFLASHAWLLGPNGDTIERLA
jgi:hypothetical protein